MIIYDLKCDNDHKFEGWFHDRKAFEEQKRCKLINCPICGSVDTEVAPSSLTVMGGDSKPERMRDKEISPLKALQLLNEYIDNNFDDVGDRFAEVAIRIHYGEEEERNIKGTTTKNEEETLREEGVRFIKIPTPKFDS
ncbi:MAG: DUF1178 family protein [Syntrophales bacterium LBB04]|nr:DUF1178 family protein [Syntrophales bacterium LBB04]